MISVACIPAFLIQPLSQKHTLHCTLIHDCCNLLLIIFTSKYPPHSCAIELSSYGMEKATLPRFINGHLFCYSFFLTASLPHKEMVYSSLFPWLNNVCQLEKGNLQAQKIDAWYSLCCVEILWVETPLRGRANSLEQNGDRKTSNEIPLPARCD